jgi:hypothetical protein
MPLQRYGWPGSMVMLMCTYVDTWAVAQRSGIREIAKSAVQLYHVGI